MRRDGGNDTLCKPGFRYTSFREQSFIFEASTANEKRAHKKLRDKQVDLSLPHE